MIRRPPRSTLFPYTNALPISGAGRARPPARRARRRLHGRVAGWAASGRAQRPAAQPAGRSEEHTSELQSRRDLVCRLLLEKKKKREGERTTMVDRVE